MMDVIDDEDEEFERGPFDFIEGAQEALEEAQYDRDNCCPDPGCSGNPCTFPGYAESH